MSTLAKNTLFLTSASIGQKAIAFLYFTVIARTVGVENTGAYFLALALVTTIGVLDDIGLTSVLIREIAKKPAEAATWLRNVLGVKLLTMPLTVLVAWFVPTLFGYDGAAAALVRLAVVIMLADTLSLTFYGVLRGMHRLKYESIGIFFGQAITTALGAYFLTTGQGTLPMLIIALIAGSSWNALFAAYHVSRRLGLRAFVPSFNLGSVPARMAFAFFLAAIFVKVYSYVDSFMLNAFIGKEAVGLYSVAYKLTYAFQFLPLAFVGALYPTLASKANDPAELKRIFLNAVWYLALLAAPIIFGIFALAPEIVGLFYGDAYARSVLPLSILIFDLFFIFLDFPIGALLNATGRQMTKTLIMGATMIVNVVANLILVPRFGVVGASISAVVSFVFLFVMGFAVTRRVIAVRLNDLLRATAATLFSGVMMALAVMALKNVIAWPVTIPVGAVVFFGCALATKAFTREHLATLRSLIRPKPYGENTSPDA